MRRSSCWRRASGRPLHRFVYASSSSVYGDNVSIPMREDALPQPVSPYGVTKLAAEQLCYLYLVNTASRRRRCGTSPYTGRGSGRTWRFTVSCARRSTASRSCLYGDGEQTRDFTFVSDAVAATMAAGERGVPGRAYNIGGGSRVTVNEVLEIVERLVGRPVQVRREPAQKGDMRDTYADTDACPRGSRVRAGGDAGTGTGIGVSMAFDYPCAS